MRQSNILAYTAGIIDGEGCITIANGGKVTAKGHRQRVLVVNVSNTNEWLVQWLKMQYGGNVSIYSSRNRPAHYKTLYKWTIGSRAALAFLELVVSYLQIKRPQAEVAIRFQKQKQVRPKVGERGLSDEVRAVEQAERILIQSYNKTGRRDIENVRTSRG